VTAGGPLNAIRWAREQRAHRQLPRAEGDALQTVATFSDGDGVCRPGVETLAAALGLSRRQAHRLLHRLEARGLLVSERRGRRPAVRRLRLEIEPVEQLALDVEHPACSPTETVIDDTFNVTPTSHQAPAQCDTQGTSDVTSRCHTKSQEEPFNGGEDARDTGSPVRVLAAALQEALDILATAKPQTLAVEPLAVNATLEAFPAEQGYDHRQAAHELVAWTWDALGPPTTSSANRLLASTLRKQKRGERPAAGQRGAGRAPVAAGGGDGQHRDFARFSRSAGW
jgi:DNA-binding transcriptional ArsR family regulator